MLPEKLTEETGTGAGRKSHEGKDCQPSRCS